MKIVAPLLALALSFPVLATEKDCKNLKDFFSTEKTVNQASSQLSVLEDLIKRETLCAKNLLGKILYEGTHLPKDEERAHAIFYELGNEGYAPAQFNLAYLLANKPETDKAIILPFIQGLVINYMGHSEYGYLALKARDLGREFIENRLTENREAAMREFEGLVRTATANAAAQIREKTNQRRENEDALMGLITAGVYGATLASRLGSANLVQGKAGLVGLQPRLYSVHPVGGNFLWLIPR